MISTQKFFSMVDVYRQYKGYTIDDLCNQLEIHRQTWFKWRKGGDMKTSTLFRICNMMGVSWEVLAREDITEEQFIQLLQRYGV